MAFYWIIQYVKEGVNEFLVSNRERTEKFKWKELLKKKIFQTYSLHYRVLFCLTVFRHNFHVFLFSIQRNPRLNGRALYTHTSGYSSNEWLKPLRMAKEEKWTTKPKKLRNEKFGRNDRAYAILQSLLNMNSFFFILFMNKWMNFNSKQY